MAPSKADTVKMCCARNEIVVYIVGADYAIKRSKKFAYSEMEDAFRLFYGWSLIVPRYKIPQARSMIGSAFRQFIMDNPEIDLRV